jgi:hypothetical protein
VPRSWPSSAVAAAVFAAVVLQGPGTRLTYRVRVLELPARAVEPWELATGSVSGPLDTDLRFSMRTDSVEVEALFHVVSEADTVNLAAEFFTKRRVGRSRRGLPLWEQDAYRRGARFAWGDTVRIYLSGRPRSTGGGARSAWIELALQRGFAGGEGRPGEEVRVADGGPDVRLEAVVRPRRARVVLNLVRGDTISGPRGLDLVPEAPARRTQLVVGGRRSTLDVSLTRLERTLAEGARDRALAIDADVVCLRVVPQGAADPVGVLCGRLNNVARRLPLPNGDTLVVTFAWPAGR